MTKHPTNLETFKTIKEQRISWEERKNLIHRQFPSTASLDWGKVFSHDVSIMGRIINDILKADEARPGKVGKRSSLDEGSGQDRFRQLMGGDYTTKPFPEAFSILVAKRSLRSLGNRLSISHTTVSKLLSGETTPTAQTMEKVALVFKKQPEYFVEYRVAYIVGMLARRLDAAPEMSVGLYRKLHSL